MSVPQKIKTEKRLPLLLAFLSCCLLSASFAQHSPPTQLNIATIKGTVVDSATNNAQSNVTIVLKEAGKSQALRITSTDQDGSFELQKIPYGQYQLGLSLIGYETKTVKLQVAGHSAIDLGQLRLAVTTYRLKEIKVVAQKPLVEEDIDKISYNVEADPEREQLSAFELLRKVPLLSVDADDNLQVNGTENYRVLINGMTSSLFVHSPEEVLKSLPARSIKTIEVITRPSNQYGSENLSGVVNLITYKKNISGYTGFVNAAMSDPSGSSLSGFGNVNTNKVGLSGNIGTIENTVPATTSHLFRKDKQQENDLVQNGESSGRNRSRYAGLELNYSLSAFNTIIIGLSKNIANSRSDFSQHAELVHATGRLIQSYDYENNSQYNSKGNTINFSWKHNFKKSDGHFFSFNFQLNNSQSNGLSDLTLQPLVNYKGQVSQSKNHDEYSYSTFQATYVRPMKKQTLEVGIRTVFRPSRSDYTYQDQVLTTGEWMLNPALSNLFDYKERISTAYVSLNLKLGRWGLLTGVRTEQLNAAYKLRAADTDIRQDNVTVIPNVSLLRRFKKGKTASLSYTQRIERPSPFMLNPAVDATTDPRNISFGNPKLFPATVHLLNLGFSTFGKAAFISVNVFHHFTNNSIQQYTTLTADTIVRTTFGNIGQRKTYGVMVNGNANLLKRLSVNLSLANHYNQYTSFIAGKPQINKGNMFSFTGTISCRFFKSWRASSSFGYSSSAVLAQGKAKGSGWNTVTVTKTFLKDSKAFLTLTVRNLFPAYRSTSTEVADPTSFYQLRQSRVLVRQFNLSVGYRFGKISAGTKK